MKCNNCGKEHSDHAKFCPYCGSPVVLKEMAEESVPHQEAAPKEPAFTDTLQQSDASSEKDFLQISLFILAGFCAVFAFRDFLNSIQLFSYYGSGSIWEGIGSLIFAACGIAMMVSLILIAIAKNRKRTDQMFMLLCGVALVEVIGAIFAFIVRLIQSFFNFYGFFFQFFQNVSSLLVTFISMILLVGVTYSLLKLSGVEPDVKKTTDTVSNKVQQSASDFKEKRAAKAAAEKAAAERAAAERAAAASAAAAYQNQDTASHMDQDSASTNQNTESTNQNTTNQTTRMPLQEDRGIFLYVVLSLLTCGIYSYYVIYTIARDVNVACSGDGQATGGLLKFIILSILTCGIYAWWWQYSLGNRLAINAPRYGLTFAENGTTVLMWNLFGCLLCGIGPFIAMSIIIKNTNALCYAYNRAYGLK